MVTTLRTAIHKTDNVLRARIHLTRKTSQGNYFIDIDQYDDDGYYRADKSFTIVEFSELNSAIDYFEELLLNNKLVEVESTGVLYHKPGVHNEST